MKTIPGPWGRPTVTAWAAWRERPELEPLLPIFRRLVQVYDRYLNNELRGKYLDDSPFWNRERPQVGFLAAAAWLAKGAALEEYRANKKNTKRGRCDLYIRTGLHHLAFEAKQHFLSLPQTTPAPITGTVALLEKSLQDAEYNASQLTYPRWMKTFAISFASLSVSDGNGSCAAALEALGSALRKHITSTKPNFDLVLFISLRPHIQHAPTKGSPCPGIVITLKKM